MPARSACVITVVILLSAIPASAKSKPPTPKLAQAVLLQLRKSHAAEYADHTAKGRTALVATLKAAAMAAETEDQRYVVLQEAGQVAADGGLIDDAFAIALELNDSFEIDVFKLKGDYLNAARRSDTSEAGNKKWSGLYVEVANEASDAEQFDAAIALQNQAQTLARQLRDPALQKELTRRGSQLKELAKEWKGVASHRARLEKDPQDGNANLAVGSYLCFLRGDWALGLPHLAAGSDSALATLASDELKGSPDLQKIADAWWVHAEKARGLAKDEQQRHAAELYRAILPELAAAERTRVEQRIASAPADRSEANASSSDQMAVPDFSDNPALSLSHRVAKLVLAAEGRVGFRDSAGQQKYLDARFGKSFADVPRDGIEVFSIAVGGSGSFIYAATLNRVRFTLEHLKLIGQLATLESVTLAIHCDPQDLAEIGRLPRLRHLDLTLSNRVRDPHLAFLKMLDGLESLQIRNAAPTIKGEFLNHVSENGSLLNLGLGSFSIPLSLSKAGLEQLRKMKNVTTVTLAGQTIDGVILDSLSEAPRLELLRIASPQVPRLKPLQKCEALRAIHFEGTTVRSGQLDDLTLIPQLREIRFWRSTFLEGGLASLCRHVKLERLTLGEYRCGTDEFQELAKLKQLTSLSLLQAASNVTTRKVFKLGSGLSDADLGVVKSLPALAELSIASVDVTSACLTHLEGLSRLKKFQVRTYGRISDREFEPLRQQLPNCEIQIITPQFVEP